MSDTHQTTKTNPTIPLSLSLHLPRLLSQTTLGGGELSVDDIMEGKRTPITKLESRRIGMLKGAYPFCTLAGFPASIHRTVGEGEEAGQVVFSRMTRTIDQLVITDIVRGFNVTVLKDETKERPYVVKVKATLIDITPGEQKRGMVLSSALVEKLTYGQFEEIVDKMMTLYLSRTPIPTDPQGESAEFVYVGTSDEPDDTGAISRDIDDMKGMMLNRLIEGGKVGIGRHVISLNEEGGDTHLWSQKPQSKSSKQPEGGGNPDCVVRALENMEGDEYEKLKKDAKELPLEVVAERLMKLIDKVM